MRSVIDAVLEEHQAMADTLTEVGPHAPTLVPGWTTTELAAHLASLEAGGGIVLFVGRQLITRVYPRPTKGSRWLAARALDRTVAKGYERSIAAVRKPHKLPMRWGGAPVAMFEVFTHHQDVVRANLSLPARAAPAELASCLPWLLAFHAKRLDGVHLEIETDDGTQTAGAGERVAVSGDTGEVVLWLAGRSPHCDVNVEGTAQALERVDLVTRI